MKANPLVRSGVASAPLITNRNDWIIRFLKHLAENPREWFALEKPATKNN
jgi:hypothetical protein